MNIQDLRGLSSQEVTQKQQADGYNELPDHEKKSTIKIIFEIVTEPMIFLLLAIVVVYFLLGDKSEAAVLMVSVFAIASIQLYQNSKTEKALEALRNLSSPNCQVIRDGEHVIVPSRELVVGDIVLVAEGDRVPADARLLDGQNIMSNESLLTGESVPVDKIPSSDNSYSSSATLYSGAMVVKGHGVSEVIAIGTDTEIGKIGKSLNAIKPEKTILQKELDSVVMKLAVFAVAASLLLTLAFWVTRGDLLNGFLAGLTLSIAILPEEFPVVWAVFMALGAWRLAKNNVLTRKSQTIETLGSASVLCTDKTGTLTENRMSIHGVININGDEVSLDDPLYGKVVAEGVLASQVKPFDPMEEAFIKKAAELGPLDDIYDGYRIIKEYPLEPTSLSVAHVWGDESGEQKAVAVKGAPEAIFKLCKLPPAKIEQLLKVVKRQAEEGLRILAVASGKPLSELPKKRESYEYELLGFVTLADPIRKEAAEAVALCKQAGIRVIMITGDYAETARRIGREIGLDAAHVMTGDEFGKMSEAEQQAAVEKASIFSRVAPNTKLLIVNALKNNGEVVAMTGDGVNDAPALKSAHIGISMGKRGTDVAREASSIVLLDDNFASIVQGVRTGRRIFANLQKAIMYILIVHMPIIVMSLAPVLLGWPIVLMPIHIVFLEFIIDPSCTLVFEGEREDADTMRRPPRQLNYSLFNKWMIIKSLIIGLFVSFAIMANHWLMIENGLEEATTRSVTFMMIALTNVMMILVISGWQAVKDAFTRVSAMPIVVGVVLLSLVVVYAVEPVSRFFKLTPLSLDHAGWSLAVSSSIVAVAYILRRLLPRAHY